MNSLAKLIQRWRSEAVSSLVPPPARDEIVRVFAELGSVATPDVIAMYEAIGGMTEMDNADWRLWTLVEVRTENQVGRSEGILFADYMISCWCYRLKPVDDKRSAVCADHFDGRPPSLVAGTLEQFLDEYLVNGRGLLDPGSTTKKVTS